MLGLASTLSVHTVCILKEESRLSIARTVPLTIPTQYPPVSDSYPPFEGCLRP